MSRPSTHDDLNDYQRKGHIVATITAEWVTKFPTIGMPLLAAIVEAKTLGMDFTEEQIILPLTIDELDANLASLQRSWDAGKDLYETFVETGERPKYEYVWTEYLRAEGITAPAKVEVA